MNEAFLHYVWQHKLLAHSALTTREGKPVRILKPGLLNTNSGPDFLNAHLQIGTEEWFGNVEMHVHASDFIRHDHASNPHYDNLILHVVYEDDVRIPNLESTKTPTLEIAKYIPPKLLQTYGFLQRQEKRFVPCEGLFRPLSEFEQLAWTERLLYERWESKNEKILPKNTRNVDWERLLFVKMARALGQSINADAMEAWAEKLPWQAIQKTRKNSVQLFALLLGTAGFLDDAYPSAKVRSWKSEFRHLQHKFALGNKPPIAFRFFRLRPHSFPTLRIAQLANLLTHYPNWFSRWIENLEWNSFHDEITQLHLEEFWNTHFSLKEESPAYGIKKISSAKCQQLYINAILPIRYAHQRFLGNTEWETLVAVQNQLNAEQNTITKGFSKLGWKAKNASESQAQIHLKKNYCDTKKCLHCRFGHYILNV